jgi:Family of unknown function (DUF6527)
VSQPREFESHPFRVKYEIRPWVNSTNGEHGIYVHFWCPACDDLHAIEIEVPAKAWEFSVSVDDLVTVSPSIAVTGTQWPEGAHFHKGSHNVEPGGKTTCHSFIRNGKWQFLSDCIHALANQTVEMVDLPDWLVKA